VKPVAHTFNGSYTDPNLRHIEFPLGGIGAGMICLEGTGGFSSISLRHAPRLFTKSTFFAAVTIKGASARVLEGPVPDWRIFGPAYNPDHSTALGEGSYGLPRFESATCQARFPFAEISLRDESVPLDVEITGWSPFTPADADSSSLPVAAVEYRFYNPTQTTIESVFSFHAENIMAAGDAPCGVSRNDDGFTLWQDGDPEHPWNQGAMSIGVSDGNVAVDCRWFRGKWFDSLTMLWNTIANGELLDRPAYTDGKPSGGGSLYVPFTLKPGEERTITVRLCWYVPFSNLRDGLHKEFVAKMNGTPISDDESSKLPKYRPWYAGRFSNIEEVRAFWSANIADLRRRSSIFRDAMYDSTLPPEVMEAVTANLCILKSTTVLRQEDGRFWLWEGCRDFGGSCYGSCTHVWNYAQAVAHLFPELERSLRETEFTVCQDERGHQNFRVPVPIPSEVDHSFHAAADGQLGGIMKVYRDWRISGDTDWLRELWPAVRQSLMYCIETWDPDSQGAISYPHHNTYDIEFHGPAGMCTSFYLGALIAAVKMATAIDDDPEPFATLADRSRNYLETTLFNGEYFYQTPDAAHASGQLDNIGECSEEEIELLRREGPKYQYGSGCLSDGILGAWIAETSGIGEILPEDKVKSHLLAVYRHNLRRDLSNHANPQRPGYAVGHEGGLLLCTWPRGGKPSLPFVYSDEVWTGIEYQVASHLIMMGCVDEGLEIVRIARSRYDGRVRNPFDEYECGHWYGRALSSYGLLQALSGARYDAVEKALYLQPRIPGDFRSFLGVDGGFGVVGVRKGEPFLDVRMGAIPIERIEYVKYESR